MHAKVQNNENCIWAYPPRGLHCIKVLSEEYLFRVKCFCFSMDCHTLTSSRREYYIFSGLRAGLFLVKMWKKYLVINNFSVNETKSGQPFLIDIWRIKWLVFYRRLSSAQLDCWQAPTQRPIIDQHLVEQTAYWREIKDYKSVFTNSWLVHQRNRSWIKGLGRNPQKSELVHSWQCLLSGATEPWTQGLRETIACI